MTLFREEDSKTEVSRRHILADSGIDEPVQGGTAIPFDFHWPPTNARLQSDVPRPCTQRPANSYQCREGQALA